MSKRDHAALSVLEWSATHVTLHEPGVNQHLEAAAIEQLSAASPVAQRVIMALSRRTSFVKTTRVPDVPKAEVARVLQLQMGTLFPVAGAELAMDFMLTDDVSPEGRLAVVAATRTESLRQLHAELAAAGYTAHQIVPAALGSTLLAQSVGLSDCAVVEHTGEGLSIDIVAEGRLAYSRVAPFPKTSTEIEAEVCRTFAIAKRPCSEVVAAGGLAFDGADHLVATRVSEAFTHHLGDLPLHLELPEAALLREQQRVRARARLAVLLWMAVLVAGLLVYFDRADAAAKVARSEARWNTDLRKVKSAVALAESKNNRLGKLQITLRNAFWPAQKPYDVLAMASNAVPGNAWLTGITFERGRPLLLRGSTTSDQSVAAYLNRLRGDKRFRDVRPVFANNSTVENLTIVQFSISAHVVGNFPLVEIAGRGARRP